MDGHLQPTLKLATAYSATAPLDECSPGEQVLHLGCDRGYATERLIGRGSFGAAFLVRDAQGEERVMKAIDLSSLKPTQRESAPLEPEIMQQLRHPYIVRYRESFLEKGMLAIVMDYAGAGDLLRQVEAARQQQTSLPEDKVVRWFVQALLGVKYMHNLNVIHRDLKNENLFLESENHLRIGDFGLARMLRRPTQVAVEHQIVGTPYYLSPEICSKGMYSTASDMWALGCILYELLSLTVPFDATNLPSLMVKIAGPASVPRVSSACSAELADLCASLMVKTRTDRPSAGAALQQPVLRQTVRGLLEEVSRLKTLEEKEVTSDLQATQKGSEEPPLISAARHLIGGTAPNPSALDACCKVKTPRVALEPEIVKLEARQRSSSPVKPRQHRAPLEMTALPLPAPGAAAVDVQTTRERAPPPSARAEQEGRPRSLSPDVAYKHHLLLSKSGAGAVGAPQQWLREQRRERSLSNLHVKNQQQARAEKPQIPRLQLLSPGEDEKPLSELDILSAEALPPSAWTSARRRPTVAPLPSYRAVADSIVRSKSSSALSSARVDSARNQASNTGLGSYRKPPVTIQPPPLRLDRIQEKPTSGKVGGPSASRGFPLKGLERAKSAAALPSSRAETIVAPPSARMESARRAKSSERRDASKEHRANSKERRRQKAPLRTALKAGLLLQNVGVAIGAAQDANPPPSHRDAPPSQREQLRQYRSQQRRARPAQPVVEPLLLQQAQQGKPASRAVFRNPSAPAGLHSARGDSKPRIHQLQRHGVAVPKDL